MKFEPYIYAGDKKLRRGFTTGTAACAAVKACCAFLFSDKALENVIVTTPQNIELDIPIFEIKEYKNGVLATVVKDGGDDADATNGAEISAYVQKVLPSSGGCIEIVGGEGVGVITRGGLKLPVGEHAINPIPQEMIRNNSANIIPYGSCVSASIIVPDGEKIAENTFNPRLGIIGGISILGTTGIVEPMSIEAIKESIALELNVIREQSDFVALVPGRQGEVYATQNLSISSENVCMMSNFVGFALDKCVELKFREVMLVGHIGKFIKIAAGIFNTHSHESDAKNEIITAFSAYLGASNEILNKLFLCNTTDESVKIINENCLGHIYPFIERRIEERAGIRTMGKVKVKAKIYY